MTADNADFIAKLRQIEEQANIANAELAPGLLRSQLQHMAVLAKTLRGRLELGTLAIVRADPEAPRPGDHDPAPPRISGCGRSR